MDEALRMLAQCVPGVAHAVAIARKNGKEVLMPKVEPRGGIEVWGWPEEDDIGIVVADPSSGVRDPDVSDAQQPRNPAGLILGSVKQRAILARYVGYSNSHELGLMARDLCNRCPRWIAVVETNGGWGETFLRSFRDAESATPGNLWYERDQKTGDYAREPGWNQTTSRRGELVAALQRAVSEQGSNPYGPGCWRSSAIAAGLAKGEGMETAVRNAKAWITDAIAEADRFAVGHGHGPVLHFHKYY